MKYYQVNSTVISAGVIITRTCNQNFNINAVDENGNEMSGVFPLYNLNETMERIEKIMEISGNVYGDNCKGVPIRILMNGTRFIGIAHIIKPLYVIFAETYSI